MSQRQRTVPLVLLGGERKDAVATGNNAAWLCPCGTQLPLVGKAGSAKGVTQNMRVDCQGCNRHYYVVPDGYDGAKVFEVREVT